MALREEILLDGSPQGCLIITRKLGEGIRVVVGGQVIDVMLAKIKGRQTRVAVRCDKNIQIDRIKYKDWSTK